MTAAQREYPRPILNTERRAFGCVRAKKSKWIEKIRRNKNEIVLMVAAAVVVGILLVSIRMRAGIRWKSQ